MSEAQSADNDAPIRCPNCGAPLTGVIHPTVCLINAAAEIERLRTSPASPAMQGLTQKAADPPTRAIPTEAKWIDLFGIDPDYTEGKPVDEWLEEHRGDA